MRYRGRREEGEEGEEWVMKERVDDDKDGLVSC